MRAVDHRTDERLVYKGRDGTEVETLFSSLEAEGFRLAAGGRLLLADVWDAERGESETRLYDLTINTGRVAPEAAVDLIVGYVRASQGPSA